MKSNKLKLRKREREREIKREREGEKERDYGFAKKYISATSKGKGYDMINMINWRQQTFADLAHIFLPKSDCLLLLFTHFALSVIAFKR